MFTTERLILRAFQDDDAARITHMRNNIDVQRNVSTRAIVPLGPQNAQTVQKYVSDATLFVTIVLKETGEFVGTSKLAMKTPKNRDCTFSICLLPEFWGKGYGKEVSRFMVDYGFRWLGLHRVSLTVVEGNKRAISIYEKIGFKLEGIEREANFVDGRWEDVYNMGILESEWGGVDKRAVDRS